MLKGNVLIMGKGRTGKGGEKKKRGQTEGEGGGAQHRALVGQEKLLKNYFLRSDKEGVRGRLMWTTADRQRGKGCVRGMAIRRK